jgi:GTP-binding protein Era
VFIDTPGFHRSDKKINLRLRDLVTGTIAETDMILYVVDSTRSAGEEEDLIASKLGTAKVPVIVALNKIDIEPNLRLENHQFILERIPAAPAVFISAMTGVGLEDLSNALFSFAPEGDRLYPEDYYTDQEPEFRASEIIREKAFLETREEVPHSLYVEIADMEASENEGDDEKPKLWIRAFLVVERESQKGILVGRDGSRIKSIRVAAQKDLGKIFSYRIHLDLRVKVRPRWRRDDNLLKRLIR